MRENHFEETVETERHYTNQFMCVRERKKRTMFPEYILRLMQFLDCIGFFTGYSFNKYGNTIRYTVSLFLHIFFISFNFNIIQFMPAMKVIELTNAQLQYFGALFTYFVIYTESFLNRHTQCSFWSHIHLNDAGMQNKCYMVLLKFGYPVAVLSTHFVMNALFSEMPREAIVLSLTVTVLVRIYLLRILYYAIHLETIRIKLESIHVQAAKVSDSTSISVGCLTVIRRSYEQLFNMVFSVNEIFGYSQLTLVAYCFFLLFVDFNWYHVGFVQAQKTSKCSINRHVFVTEYRF